MSKLSFETLLEAGVHFGHLKRKWNPAMAPYIFEEKKGIHIIDLNKTIVHLDHACAAMKQIAKSGKKVLFVATKKQAKEIVSNLVSEVNMPFVTERWSGGMLTNFQTTRKSIRKMSSIDKILSSFVISLFVSFGAIPGKRSHVFHLPTFDKSYLSKLKNILKIKS